MGQWGEEEALGRFARLEGNSLGKQRHSKETKVENSA